jgi:hypothetical protein
MACLGLRLQNLDMQTMYGNGAGEGSQELVAELSKPTVELPDSFRELFCR